jgi:hypothetical protein
MNVLDYLEADSMGNGDDVSDADDPLKVKADTPHSALTMLAKKVREFNALWCIVTDKT